MWTAGADRACISAVFAREKDEAGSANVAEYGASFVEKTAVTIAEVTVAKIVGIVKSSMKTLRNPPG